MLISNWYLEHLSKSIKRHISLSQQKKLWPHWITAPNFDIGPWNSCTASKYINGASLTLSSFKSSRVVFCWTWHILIFLINGTVFLYLKPNSTVMPLLTLSKYLNFFPFEVTWKLATTSKEGRSIPLHLDSIKVLWTIFNLSKQRQHFANIGVQSFTLATRRCY